MKVFIIGTGNVATALGKAILKSGHEVTGVWGRDEKLSAQLARKLKCRSFQKLDSIPGQSDFYILAIKDDAIHQVANSLPDLNGIVVHTSGATPMKVLKKFKRRGVFYPVETITKTSPSSFKNVPICIEAADDYSMRKILKLAETVSNEIYVLDSSQRAALHVAAVFTNNFTNYLLGAANDILQQKHLPSSLLKQLAISTVMNVFNKGAFSSQTGPAKRNDVNTIKSHLDFLQNNKEYQQLYRILTRQIKKVHNKGRE